jgi:2-polyprenyl-3-methyl-5-hydroxy-6-metoxy-1,4-benzoquinol methylase
MTSPAVSAPTERALRQVFVAKYGRPEDTGSSPRLRWDNNYFNPDDHYEALVESLVTEETAWMDVGCGRFLFPSNRVLAEQLAARAERLCGIDPDETIHENPFIHEAVQAPVDEFRGNEDFDLVTMRMVAEHIENPTALAKAAASILKPGGLLVIYTVNKFSPVPLITSVAPYRLHNPVKSVLWGTQAKDTFPTQFKMNTRKALSKTLGAQGLDECLFLKLDDCRTFTGFKALAVLELKSRKLFNTLGFHYPENCLLGVYRKQ